MQVLIVPSSKSAPVRRITCLNKTPGHSEEKRGEKKDAAHLKRVIADFVGRHRLAV